MTIVKLKQLRLSKILEMYESCKGDPLNEINRHLLNLGLNFDQVNECLDEFEKYRKYLIGIFARSSCVSVKYLPLGVSAEELYKINDNF